MKCLSKTGEDSGQNFLEANLLVQLKHPAIPILYDIEEDEETIRIIEEYMEGQSLEEYLLCHKTISQLTLFNIAIQLCEVMEYLHSYMPYPILYQDMKPNHIIVCGNQIKLIDYGIAFFLTSQGNNFQKYGTKGYAPPEQYTSQPSDERVDIYGVGRVLKEMLPASTMKNNPMMRYLVGRACNENPNRRPDNIQWIHRRLKKIQQIEMTKNTVLQRIRKVKKNNQENHLLETIAVIGSEPGVGTTHIAISAAVSLRAMGYVSFYEDYGNGRILQRILKESPEYTEEDGIIYHDLFHGIPQYGDAIEQREPLEGIRVMDYGSRWRETETIREQVKEADLIIFVISARPWQRVEDFCEEIADESMRIVCNHYSVGVARKYARKFQRPVIAYAYDEDPFSITEKKKKIFRRMIF